jgi:hypothetical protein
MPIKPSPRALPCNKSPLRKGIGEVLLPRASSPNLRVVAMRVVTKGHIASKIKGGLWEKDFPRVKHKKFLNSNGI